MERKTTFEMVEDFHEVYGHVVNKEPTVPEVSVIKLRLKLILEEFVELIEAITKTNNDVPTVITKLGEVMDVWLDNISFEDLDVDLVEVSDALGDIKYVVDGAALVFGIPFDDVFNEIHRSNMSKLDPETGLPIKREDGKILKGDSYSPPDLKSILYG